MSANDPSPSVPFPDLPPVLASFSAATAGPVAPAARGAEAKPFEFPRLFFAALSYPVRVWMVQRLASGAELTPTQFLAELGGIMGLDAMNEHCKTLHAGGVASARQGKDRRTKVYFIPESIRREPGWLDYGWCRFRVK